jgi:acetyl esterase/lipase
VLNAGNGRYDMTDPNRTADARRARHAEDHKAADPSKVIVRYCRPTASSGVRGGDADHRRGGVVRRGVGARMGVNKLQPKRLEDIIAAVNCPVFGAFGEGDHIISLDDVLRFRNCLEANKKSYDIHIYRGAPHGWLNDTMPGRYRKAEADAGWAAQQRFLTEVFGGQWDGVVRWQLASDSGKDYDFSKNVRME